LLPALSASQYFSNPLIFLIKFNNHDNHFHHLDSGFLLSVLRFSKTGKILIFILQTDFL